MIRNRSLCLQLTRVRLGYIKKQDNRYMPLSGWQANPYTSAFLTVVKNMWQFAQVVARTPIFFSFPTKSKWKHDFTQISNILPNSSIYGAFTWHSPPHFFPRSAYSIIHLYLLGQQIQKKGSNSSTYTFFIWAGKHESRYLKILPMLII